MKNPKFLFAAILIFVGCLCVGFFKAQHRGIWNDEYYSQVSSVHNISYADQFLGHIAEGGNAPLFYVLQKFFLQLFQYQTPSSWLQGHWQNDALSQILLRVNPVIFMSLSLTLVFYYFFRQYSLIVAMGSMFIYFSSYMLWAYWAEARPYALLVFLTTLQSVIFLKRADQKEPRDGKHLWVMLGVTNSLLSLTSILSLGEILAASVLWAWMFKERDWKKYILVTVLPLLLVLFYYVHAPKYQFFFGLSPEQLIRDNIPRQRFDILFMFIILLSIYGFRQKVHKETNVGSQIIGPMGYVIFMALVLAASALLLMAFAMHAKHGQGFPITSRYFIYLTPIGVIATTLMSVSIFKSLSKYRLLQWLLMGLIGLLLIQNFLKTFPKAIHGIMGGQ